MASLLVAALLLSQGGLAAAYRPVYLPNTVEAEHYDAGGQGAAYGDTTRGNDGAVLREDDVDIFQGKGNTAYVLMQPGEWMRYTVSVRRRGSYAVSVNAMLPAGETAFSVYVDDTLLLHEKELVSKTDSAGFALYDLAAVFLDEGAHTLILACAGKKAGVDLLRITNTDARGLSLKNGAAGKPATPALGSPKKDLGFPEIDFFNPRASAEPFARIYVSPQGSDSADGTREAPFLTVARAAEQVRGIKAGMSGDIIVHIGAGTYHVTEPLSLKQADGGEGGYRVIYQGEPGAVISGGRRIEGFSRVEQKPYWVADLSLDEHLYELYVNGHRAKVASSEYKYQPAAAYDDPATREGKDGLVFSASMLPLEFDDAEGMFFSNTFEWVYNLVPVKDFVTLPDGGKLVTGVQPYALWYEKALEPQYPVYFLNHRSLLDRPGEFFYAKKEKKLYYYPFEGEEPDGSYAYIPVSEGLVDIRGTQKEPVRNISFKNITFRHGQWKRTWEKGFAANQAENYIEYPEKHNWSSRWEPAMPAQFQVSYADGIEIVNNSFENLSAVAVQFLDSVSNSRIGANTFYDIGAAAITVGKGTHQDILFQNAKNICRYITVDNNLIREVGQIYQSSPAITAYYVNNCSIVHNDIEYVPYSGISLGWGWGNDEPLCRDNAISHNRIVNVMHSLWDGSHIYTLSNIGGTVIEGNYLGRTDEACSGGTYYPDEGTDDAIVKNNVFENPRLNKIGWMRLGVTYENNYVEKLAEKTSYGDINEVQRAGFHVFPDRDWPEAAQKIIANAGLLPRYKYLLKNFASAQRPENIFRTNLPRFIDRGTYITVAPGRDFITEGGEGVAFHDSDDWNQFDGYGDGPDWGGMYWSIGYNSDADPEWLQYRVKTDREGDYKIYVEAAAFGDSFCQIYRDGVLVVDDGKIRGSGNWSLNTHNHIGDIRLEKDREHIIKFAFKKGAFNFNGLYFALQDGHTTYIDGNFKNLTAEEKGEEQT